MTKILVVDDSALMRKCLREILESEAGWTVVTARNGRDALAQIAVHNPDVVTLDINMPEMDGLSCLAEIMTHSPRPVVMVSSITAKGAQVTLEALELGAVDFVEKPGGTVSLNIDTIEHQLINKVRTAAKAKPRRARGLVKRVQRSTATRPRSLPAARQGSLSGIVVVGVSTGGPRTLEDVLPRLPIDFPWPVVIAQHMPGAFTASFAQRLDNICELEVVEVTGPQPLRQGMVYIGRGNADIVVERRLGRLVVDSVPEDSQLLWHPSVDRLVRAAMRAIEPARLTAVQLTGMGNDGADAMAELRRAGGHTIAEHESTAIVYGMPAELVRLGGAEVVLPSTRIADQLISWAG
jgi:two-component system chemotaxis response regulator CheB